MKKKLLIHSFNHVLLLSLILLFFASFIALHAQTVLQPMDIVIVNMNHTPNDVLVFAFMNVAPLSQGTEIYFTDRGIKSDGTFNDKTSHEGTVKIIIPESIPSGSILKYHPIMLNFPEGYCANDTLFKHAWSEVDNYGDNPGIFDLNQNGDQIIVYQITGNSISIIFAVNYFGSDWQLESSNENESCCPPNLINGITAIAFDRTVLKFSENNLFFDIGNYTNYEPPLKGSGEKIGVCVFMHLQVMVIANPYADFALVIYEEYELSQYIYEHYNDPGWEQWRAFWEDLYNVIFTSSSIPQTVIYVPGPPDPGGTIIINSPAIHGLECPVELSSFTAFQTDNNLCNIKWITQSETNVLGFNIYRGGSNIASLAQMVNFSAIGATNTSQTQAYSYMDETVETNSQYYYWLESVDLDGTNQMFGPVLVNIDSPSTPPMVVHETMLYNAYPNPFKTPTMITYDLKSAGNVQLEVYNLKGQKVRTLENTSKSVGGTYTCTWDGSDNNGKHVSSGVYFYRLQTADYLATKKVILMK